jgi:hypothetical protein
MAYDYSRSRTSRLQKIEDKKNTHQAILLTSLTVFIIALLLVFGVPVMTKFAIFIGDLRSTNSTTEENQNETFLTAPTLYQDFEATNSAKITVKGYALPNSKIKLEINGRSLTETAATNGDFKFANVLLDGGDNKITAYMVADEKESEPSKQVVITYDATPPTLIVDTPQDGQKFFDFDKDIDIKGTSEPDVQLSVNGHYLIVGTNGTFSTSMTLENGDNQVIVEAEDKAGNRTKSELTIQYLP